MNNKIKERILCLMLGVGVAAAVGVTGCGKSDASSDGEETAKTEDMQGQQIRKKNPSLRKIQKNRTAKRKIRQKRSM